MDDLGATHSALGVDVEETVDPDPFSIALGIFGIIASGGAFLEARRQRQFMERQQQQSFRSAWFAAQRTLIHFKQVVDEFETYMLEDNYGGQALRIGIVHLTVDRGRHQALKRLHGQSMTTANFMADNLNSLSDFLGPEDQEAVATVLVTLSEMRVPDHYGEVITLARQAIDLYGGLLTSIGEREGFLDA